ncbi:hypothetical protein cypCar_00047686 [Cyprinus carpio]|nr:hypothetical protein cypCar_00047686 [Cyprinus carpio]
MVVFCISSDRGGNVASQERFGLPGLSWRIHFFSVRNLPVSQSVTGYYGNCCLVNEGFVMKRVNRSVGNADFKLLLKTDDDCYIDVDAVLLKTERTRLSQSSLWWGK